MSRFKDPTIWKVRSGVPVFDAHDDYTPERLRLIADNCNQRESKTGDACPITLGHTVLGAKEHDQPPIVGYARNFRVGKFGPGQKDGILADFWFAKERYEEALTYPRRSVELWPDELFFDPISLLRRTPRRDLGLLHAKDRKVIRYAMEDAMGDSMAYGGDQDGDDDDDDDDDYDDRPPVGDEDQNMKLMLQKMLEQYMTENPLMRYLRSRHGQDAGMPPESYDAGAASPGGFNTSLLSDRTRKMSADNEAVIKMQKDLSDHRDAYAKMQKDLACHQEAYAKLQVSHEAVLKEQTELKNRLEAETKARLETEKKFYSKECEAELDKLLAGGWKFDKAEELAEAIEGSPEKFQKQIKRIQTLYVRERKPLHNGMVVAAVTGDTNGSHPTVDSATGRLKELSPEDAKRVRDHALAKGIDYAKARAEIFPAK